MKTIKQTAKQMAAKILPISLRFFCNGVVSCLIPRKRSAILPTSVLEPVSTTIPFPRP